MYFLKVQRKKNNTRENDTKTVVFYVKLKCFFLLNFSTQYINVSWQITLCTAFLFSLELLQVMKERLVVLCAQLLSHVQLFETPWTVAHQAPLSMGILQARILKWVAVLFFRASSLQENPGLPHCRQIFNIWATTWYWSPISLFIKLKHHLFLLSIYEVIPIVLLSWDFITFKVSCGM